jgi:hypothetical protein
LDTGDLQVGAEVLKDDESCFKFFYVFHKIIAILTMIQIVFQTKQKLMVLVD